MHALTYSYLDCYISLVYLICCTYLVFAWLVFYTILVYLPVTIATYSLLYMHVYFLSFLALSIMIFMDKVCLPIYVSCTPIVCSICMSIYTKVYTLSLFAQSILYLQSTMPIPVLLIIVTALCVAQSACLYMQSTIACLQHICWQVCLPYCAGASIYICVRRLLHLYFVYNYLVCFTHSYLVLLGQQLYLAIVFCTYLVYLHAYGYSQLCHLLCMPTFKAFFALLCRCSYLHAFIPTQTATSPYSLLGQSSILILVSVLACGYSYLVFCLLFKPSLSTLSIMPTCYWYDCLVAWSAMLT